MEDFYFQLNDMLLFQLSEVSFCQMDHPSVLLCQVYKLLKHQESRLASIKTSEINDLETGSHPHLHHLLCLFLDYHYFCID